MGDKRFLVIITLMLAIVILAYPALVSADNACIADDRNFTCGQAVTKSCTLNDDLNNTWGDTLDIIHINNSWIDNSTINPILQVSESWENPALDRSTALIDDADPTMIHLWYMGGSQVGYAMSSTVQHYPMEAYYDSAIYDWGTNVAGLNVTINFIMANSTSYLLQYRSSSLSSNDVSTKNWTTYTADNISQYRYSQFRLKLRTLNPSLTIIINNITFSDGNNNWTTNGTAWDSGINNGTSINDSSLIEAQNQAPYHFTKYWNNPVMSSSQFTGRTLLAPGAIIKDNGIYKQWYNAAGWNGGWHLGYATSPDGINWTDGNNNVPIDFYGDGNLNSYITVDPQVIKDSDGYNIWLGSSRNTSLVYSVSTDGITNWSTPVSVTNIGSNSVSVVKIGNLYNYYFEVSNDSWSIWHGTSSSKNGAVQNISVLIAKSEIPENWRQYGVGTAYMIYDGTQVLGFIKGFGGPSYEEGLIMNITTSYIVESSSTPDPLKTTCLTIGSDNIRIDCNNHSIIYANNQSNSKGIYTNYINTTIQNCNINNFTNGVIFNNAVLGGIQNSKINSSGSGIIFNNTSSALIDYDALLGGICSLHLISSSMNNISNSNISSYSSQALCLDTSTTANNTIYNNRLGSINGTTVLIQDSSYNNIFYWNNFTNTTGLYVNDSSIGSVCYQEQPDVNPGCVGTFTSGNWTISGNWMNSAYGFEALSTTIDSDPASSDFNFEGDGIVDIYYHIPADTTNAEWDIYYDGLIFARQSVPLDCMNASAPNYPFIHFNIVSSYSDGVAYYSCDGPNGLEQLYVDQNEIGLAPVYEEGIRWTIKNSNFINSYNWTVNGKNQGNIYADVMDRSVNITGTVSSSISGLYIGDNGSGYPYNQTTSNNKIVGGADYAPLTPQTSSTGPESPFGCGVLDTPNTVYNMTDNLSINDSTCFTITAENVTLDCKGYTISGDWSTDAYGVFSNQRNTTIRNCDISGFDAGIYFENVSDGLIINTSAYSGSIGDYGDFGVDILLSSSFNVTIINATLTSDTSGDIYLIESSSNIFSNCAISTMFGLAVFLNLNSSHNTFYWNNFTSIGGFIDDRNGDNNYNVTIDGKNQGNMWANVLNGSVNITGTVSSSISGLYIGNNGSGYPYSNITSQGKFSCNFANCADYAPLTNQQQGSSGPAPIDCGNLNIANTEYNMTDNVSINGSTCFNITADNVTLDCKGFSIKGNNAVSTYGIYSNQNKTIVQNCDVFDFDSAIKFFDVTSGSIINVTVKVTTQTGGDNNDGGDGFIITNGFNNQLINVSATFIQEAAGIFLKSSSNTTIINSSTYTNAAGYGIYCNSSQNTLLINSYILGDSFAVVMNSCNDNIFNNDTFTAIEGSAIEFFSSSNNTISNSSISRAEDDGLYLQSSFNNVFYNITISYSNFAGIYLDSSSGNNISFIHGQLNSKGIYLSSSDNNSINNVNISNQNTPCIHLISSSGNLIYNSNFNVSNSVGGQLESNSDNNIIANSSFLASYDAFQIYDSINNRLYNNTFISVQETNSLIYLSDIASSNVFYLNNFTATNGLYVNDTNGSNFYNFTVDSKNQGNIYFDVLNGSVNITGTVNSSIPGLYIGNNGSGYPYSESTSDGKIVGGADYAPLTPFVETTSPATGDLTVDSTVGGTAVGSTSGFAVPINLSINASASAGYDFVNWTVTAGNCTVNDFTNNVTTVQIFDSSLCNVQANFVSASSFVAFVFPSPLNGMNTRATLYNISIDLFNLTSLNWTRNNVTYDWLENLVAYWNFNNVSALGDSDSVVADISKYNQPLSMSGYTYSSGKYSMGLNSPGNVSVQASYNAAAGPLHGLNDKNFTWSIWIYINNNTRTQCTDATGGAYTGMSAMEIRDGSTMLGVDEANNPTVNIRTASGFGCMSGSTMWYCNVREFKTWGNVSIPYYEWHQITMTVNEQAKSVKLYYDGQFQSNIIFDQKMFDTTLYDNRIWIGASDSNECNSWGSRSMRWYGQLDDAQIFNKDLSADEILQNYHMTLQKNNLTSYSFLVEEKSRVTNGTGYNYSISISNSTHSESTNTQTNSFNYSCQGETTQFACGDTITESCTLNNNLHSSGTCFNVGVDNIQINLEGFTIFGDGTGIGIAVSSRIGVNISNGAINNFSTGLSLFNATSALANQMMMINNGIGINISGSNNAMIRLTTINSSLQEGIFHQNSSGTKIIYSANEYYYNSTDRKFYSDSAFNGTYNTGWMPLYSTDGNDATTQADTAWYSGIYGNRDSDYILNSSGPSFYRQAFELNAAPSQYYNDTLMIYIYNNQLSIDAAKYFSEQRGISHILGVYIDSANTRFPRRFTYYNQSIYDPIRNYLQSAGEYNYSNSTLNYIVLSAGFPTYDQEQTFNWFNSAIGFYAHSLDSEIALIGYNEANMYKDTDIRDVSKRVLNPYYSNSGSVPAFSRRQFGIFLVTRIDGYNMTSIHHMIDSVDNISQQSFKTSNAIVAPVRSWSPVYIAPYLVDEGINATVGTFNGDLNLYTVPCQNYNNLSYMLFYTGNSFSPACEPNFTFVPGSVYISQYSYAGQLMDTGINDPVLWESYDSRGLLQGASMAYGSSREPWSGGTLVVSRFTQDFVDGVYGAQLFWNAIPYLSWTSIVYGDPKASYPFLTTSVRPAYPTNLTDITCTVSIFDVASKNPYYNVTYEWYKNGVDQASLGGTVVNQIPGHNFNITLSSGNLSVGDNWTCRSDLYVDDILLSSDDSSVNIAPNQTCHEIAFDNMINYLSENATTGAICIRVSASNVTVDCQGFSIIGNNTNDSFGIYSNQNMTIIKNCNIINFTTGIYFNGSSNGTIINTNASTSTAPSGNNGYAIYLSAGASFNQIIDTAVNSTSGYGIYLINSNNNLISDSNAIATNGVGIYLSGSNATVISNTQTNVTTGYGIRLVTNNNRNNLTNITTIATSGFGIQLFQSSNNALSDINASATTGYVIELIQVSSNNTLSNINATTTSGTAIHLYQNSNNNTLINMNATATATNGKAIYIDGASSNLVNNSYAAATTGNGISLSQANTNIIYSSIATVISGYGGYITTFSSDNRIYNSTFISVNNTAMYITTLSSSNNISSCTIISNSSTAIKLDVNSLTNKFLNNNITGLKWINNTDASNTFNNSAVGNTYYFVNGSGSWTVFNISDLNGDGWTDSGSSRPFNATTTASYWSGSGADWNPGIVMPSPTVFISSPVDVLYNVSLIDLNFTASSDYRNISSCWYVLNYGPDINIPSCANTSINVPEGSNTLIVYSNDTAGYIGSASVDFTVEISTPPTVFISSPVDVLYNVSLIDLNFTVSSDYRNISSCWYSLDGAAAVNIIDCLNTTFTVTNGTHTIIVFSNDTSNHVSNFSASFSVDILTPPIITVISPINQLYNTASIDLNFTATPTNRNISSCLYSINGGINNTVTDCANTTITAVSGANTLIFYVNDSLGNIASQTIVFTTDITDPKVRINIPFNNTLQSSRTIYINVSANDTNLNYTNVSVYNATGALMTSGINTSPQFVMQLDVSSDGIYDINATAYDNVGRIGKDSVTNMTIYTGNGTMNDTTSPTILLTSPTDTTYTDSIISLNFSARDDSGISNCMYSINTTNSTGVKLSNCTSSINNSVILYLASGEYNLTVFVNDSLGNFNSTWQIFIVNDTLGPVLSGISPSGSQGYTTSVTLSVTTNENATCRYSASSRNYSTMTAFTDSVTAHTANYGVSGGISYSVFVICKDMSNNEKNTTISFSIASGGIIHHSGGGGGGGLLQDNNMKMLLDNVSFTYSLLVEGNKTINISNMLLSEMTLSMLSNSSNVKFTINKSLSNVNVYPKGKVYIYLLIDHQNLDNSVISRAVLKFKVEKSWLLNNSVSNADIVLVRYDGAAWKELVTTVLSEDSDYVYYSAQSPGLSLFAVAVKSSAATIVPTTNPVKSGASTGSTNAAMNNSSRTESVQNITSQIIGVNVKQGAISKTVTENKSLNFFVWTNALVWIIVLIIVAALMVWYYFSRSKNRSSKEELTSQDLSSLYERYGFDETKINTREAKAEAKIETKTNVKSVTASQTGQSRATTTHLVSGSSQHIHPAHKRL